ncbi:MAG: ABC transporter ATP-binding protein [Actinomycetota bacterium]
MTDARRATPADLRGSPLTDGLRLVGSYARAHRRPFTVSTVGSVVYAAGTVGSAFALGWAVDEALVPHFDGADSRHWAAVALLIGVMILRSVGVITRRYFAGMYSSANRADLQRGMADRIVAMPLDELKSQPAGVVLAHIDADAESAIEATHPAPFTIGVLSMLVFAIVGLATIDLPLMFATVGVLPIVLATSWISTIVLEKPTSVERAANAEVTAATTEIISGTQVIKTLGREDAELERFARVVDDLRAKRVRVAIMKMLIDAAFSALPQLAMILIIYVGAGRVADGILGPGDLVQAVALFGVLSFPMQVIGFFLTDLPVTVVGRRRVDSLLGRPDDPLDSTPVDPTALPPGPLGAALVDARVGEAGRPRITQFDLAIRPGDPRALVGSTGSGKSTALEVLARLRGPTAGEVAYADIAAERIADTDLRSRVTLAAQNAALFTGTVRSNVAYGRGCSPAEVDEALVLAGCADLDHILEDGFETVVGERGVTLSGGQRQRIALARALAGTPGMVLLDDATSAVDPAREEVILANLAALPTTVVLVTHRVAAMAAADRVALIDDGRVRAVGTHDHLLNDPVYRRLVEAYEATDLVAEEQR